MNIVISDEIFRLQSSGGVSTYWQQLTPRLKALLPEHTFDAAQPADVWVPTYYAPAPAGVPSVVVVYDFIHERYPGLSAFDPAAIAKRSAVLQASALISISQWTAQDTRQMMQRSSTVVYPATTLKRASQADVAAFRQKYNLPEQYVLMVGRRGLYKNASTYWQATRLFNAPLTVCIGGEPEPDSAGVRHLALPAEDVAAAYTGALCLMYPSLYEGFGLPVLEAYACGCPVVCGNGGALAEFNSAALVVNVTRPIELANAVVRLANPSERLSFIMRGYDVAQQFDWDRTAAQMAAIIRDVAEKAHHEKAELYAGQENDPAQEKAEIAV